MTTYEQAKAKMTAFAQERNTDVLCEALEKLSRPTNRQERMARAVLIEVLCDRHETADEAFQRWAESDSTDSAEADAAIVAGARAEVARHAELVTRHRDEERAAAASRRDAMDEYRQRRER